MEGGLPIRLWLLERFWGVVACLVVVVSITTAIGFFARVNWVADLCANLRIQQVIGLTVLLAITTILRRWRWCALELALLAIHLPWIVSLDMLAKSHPEPDVTREDSELDVMLANVLTSNSNHEGIVDQICAAEPDVLVILELSTELSQRLERDLRDRYPHRIANPMDRSNFGWGPTWYARDNFAFGLKLDHGLISDDLRCVSHRIGDEMGSDHRAVTIGIRRRGR